MLGFVPPERADVGLNVIDAWTGRHPG